MHSYDIVYCVGPHDKEIIRLSVESVRKWVEGIRRIYIICDTPLRIPYTVDLSVELFPFSLLDVYELSQTMSNAGLYFQQLIKLYAGVVIPDLQEDYVVLDSDLIFLKPIHFVKQITPNNPTSKRWLFNSVRAPYNATVFEHMHRVHPECIKQVQESGSCHHMICNRKRVNEMIQKIEDYHLKPFWNVYLSCLDKDKVNDKASDEYELYFNYMIKFHPEQIAIRSLPFSTITEHTIDLSVKRSESYAIHPWWYRSSDNHREIRQREVHTLRYLISTKNGCKRLHNGFPETEIITAERIRLLCDMTFIPRGQETLPTLASDIRSIFVYGDDIDLFIDRVWKHLNHPVVVVVHHTDKEINERYIEWIDDTKLLHLFAVNVMFCHPKVTALPKGVKDDSLGGDLSVLSHLSFYPDKFFTEREDHIAIHFQVSEYVDHRIKVVQDLQRSTSDQKENIGVYLSNYLPECIVYSDLQNYKYCACPRSQSPDTYLLWESLYLGLIPIVDEIPNTSLFSSLPIYRVSDWKKVDKNYLTSIADDIKTSFPERWDWDCLRISWWKKKIEEKTNQSVLLNHPMQTEGTIVIVCPGRLPSYLSPCLRQIRCWNRDTPIYIAYQSDHRQHEIELQRTLNMKDIIFVSSRELNPSTSHQISKTREYSSTIQLIHKYSSERMFILEEVMKKYKLNDVLYLSPDQMIYFDFETKLNLFRLASDQTSIMIPQSADESMEPGFLYVSSIKSLSLLNMTIVEDQYHHTLYQVMKACSSSFSSVVKFLPTSLFDGVFDNEILFNLYQRNEVQEGVTIRWTKKPNHSKTVRSCLELGLANTSSPDGVKWKEIYNIRVRSRDLDRFLST